MPKLTSSELMIVSGGQTGADRAALDWAVSAGIRHGGWCPKGRLAENGSIPKRYRLKETKSLHYSLRTKMNVQDSDGTAIFTIADELKDGSALTAYFARKYSRPFLHIHAATRGAGIKLVKFVHQHGIKKLNVAGTRQSKEPLIGELVAAT